MKINVGILTQDQATFSACGITEIEPEAVFYVSILSEVINAGKMHLKRESVISVSRFSSTSVSPTGLVCLGRKSKLSVYGYSNLFTNFEPFREKSKQTLIINDEAKVDMEDLSSLKVLRANGTITMMNKSFLYLHRGILKIAGNFYLAENARFIALGEVNLEYDIVHDIVGDLLNCLLAIRENVKVTVYERQLLHVRVGAFCLIKNGFDLSNDLIFNVTSKSKFFDCYEQN